VRQTPLPSALLARAKSVTAPPLRGKRSKRTQNATCEKEKKREREREIDTQRGKQRREIRLMRRKREVIF
jgi:hypothetical protein